MGSTSSLHDENSAWGPLFGKKCVHYPDLNVLFFPSFILNVGKHMCYSVENPENFPCIKPQKFVHTFGMLTVFHLFGPTFKLSSFNFGLDPPAIRGAHHSQKIS